MKDEKFLYILGSLAYITWPLYFLLYVSRYTSAEIIEAMIVITIMIVCYFCGVKFYFS